MAKSPEQMLEVSFPFKGVHRGLNPQDQPKLTTRDAYNVRGFDPRAQCQQGCQREGISKLFTIVVGEDVSHVAVAGAVQCIDQVTLVANAASGNPNPRTIKGVAVAHGTLRSWNVGSGGLNSVTNGVNALNTTAVAIYSAEHLQKLYFADGTTAKYYDAASNAAVNWESAVTDGSFPKATTEYPRLICMWRGRIVLSGIRTDPQNWFMTRQYDPLDFDTGPTVTDEQQAVDGNASEAGKVGDVVTGLVPWGDDNLIIGGDHTIWVLRGDPMAGGRFDLVSDVTGMAFGKAWCKDPQGNLYFLGTKGGIYKLTKGNFQLERISVGIDDRFNVLAFAFNSSSTICRMAWDEINQGMYVFMTPTGGGAAVNFWYDARNQAWWPDRFTNPLFNPTSVAQIDGDLATDRCILLGCRDGYIRKADYSVNTDDDETISSYVVLGPIQGKLLEAFLLKELQALFAEDTDGGHGPVTFEIRMGHSAAAAFLADADQTGTWQVGRNRSELVRRADAAAYIKIAHAVNDKTWALEKLIALTRALGKTRQRAFM